MFRCPPLFRPLPPALVRPLAPLHWFDSCTVEPASVQWLPNHDARQLYCLVGCLCPDRAQCNCTVTGVGQSNCPTLVRELTRRWSSEK